MSHYLPVIPSTTASVRSAPSLSLATIKHARALAVQSRQIEMAVQGELERTWGSGQVVEAQFDREAAFLRRALALSGDNEALLYIAANKLASYSEANNARLRDLFG